MKVSLAQLNIILDNKSENLLFVKKYTAEAAENGADIIFFPEMTLTGFSMNVEKNGDINEETIRIMKQIAAENNIAIGFGWVRKTGNKGENHYTVVSPDKEILSDYVKIHPFSYCSEDNYFNAGNDLASFTYCGKRISTFICYDLRFPEIFQAVSDEAEIIVVAANWPERRSAHWKKLLEARAIENQAWLLGVNCCGNQNGEYYSGNSRIITPDGSISDEISDTDGLIYCTVNDEAEKIRGEFPLKSDRKVSLYREFMK